MAYIQQRGERKYKITVCNGYTTTGKKRMQARTIDVPMVEIDSILWSYCASHYGEICTAAPHCEACVVRGFCTRKEG